MLTSTFRTRCVNYTCTEILFGRVFLYTVSNQKVDGVKCSNEATPIPLATQVTNFIVVSQSTIKLYPETIPLSVSKTNCTMVTMVTVR